MSRIILRVVIGFVAALFFVGLDVSHTRSGQTFAWRVALAPLAHAQLACEFPPVDEPDGDGDECNPNYQQQVSPDKNTGDPGCNSCGNPINFATGNKNEIQTDYTGGGPLPIILTRYYNSMDSAGGLMRLAPIGAALTAVL